LKKQLIGSGYRVSVADHGQEAIDKVLAFQDCPKEMIHIILMDVEMPILNVFPSLTGLADIQGLQATSVLREKEASGELRRHIPVIAVISSEVIFLIILGISECQGRTEKENV
jgi:CheY-like chemotaxis protein